MTNRGEIRIFHILWGGGGLCRDSLREVEKCNVAYSTCCRTGISLVAAS